MHTFGKSQQPLNSPISFVTARNAIFHQLPGRYPNDNPLFVVASDRKYLFFKRVFDVVASSLVLVFVLTWLLPLLALAIKLSSKGPIFFVQKRIGLNGKPFSCLKLRTMYHQPREQEETPAIAHDARITSMGRFLRYTNLDELPQFFNVIRGSMSIIGPRPHMATDCIRFSFVIPSYRFRHIVKPGITGWAQVKGFHGPALDYESIIHRYFWDTEYIRKASLLLDLKILALTILQAGRNLLHGRYSA